jgi:hypothetical protein
MLEASKEAFVIIDIPPTLPAQPVRLIDQYGAFIAA